MHERVFMVQPVIEIKRMGDALLLFERSYHKSNAFVRWCQIKSEVVDIN